MTSAQPAHRKQRNAANDDAVLIRMEEVRRMTGLGNTTIYERIARGEFPRQIKIGTKSVAWVKSEVAEWCRERIASRNPYISASR